MTTQHTVTGDFFDGIRTAFFTDAASEAAAEPAAPDAVAIELSDWADNRAALGIRHQDSDFIGLSETDDRSGFPSWRTQQPEQIEFTEMDHYAEERTAAGIKTASAVFGAAPAQPRTHSSPYSI
jgi:hypothetical protein